MTYAEIRDDLNTGDVVLFQGTGLFSLVIRWVCSFFSHQPTMYSHVGMIVREGHRILLFESTTLNGKSGVQINPFSTVVKSYKGRLWVRHLRTDLQDWQVKVLTAFIEQSLGKKYDPREVISAATPWHVFKGDNKRFFCSELVIRVYQLWKLITTDIYAKEFSPQDFAFLSAVDMNLRFAEQAACLTKEVEITK